MKDPNYLEYSDNNIDKLAKEAGEAMGAVGSIIEQVLTRIKIEAEKEELESEIEKGKEERQREREK